ncbi:MAG TPA: histidine kinase dimerization/phospho-acceptor domain-containing protein [Patescibacteria group bacterium]|nr:histidine kinase dimerization/phospho-acceptor domain-containing protein [Patescibacteria group bacterium]
MSHDPAAANAGPEPVRVLALESAGVIPPLASILSAEGYAVDTVALPADLSAALSAKPSYDAIVLHLTTRAIADEAALAVADALDRPGSAGARPQVILVATAQGLGGSGGSLARLGAYATMTSRDEALLRREVRSSVAVGRMDRALAEIDRLRKAVLFARQTAHELAQPLTTILARAQLLRNALKPDDPHSRAVGIICDEADRLAKMMEEFQKLKVIARPPVSREG